MHHAFRVVPLFCLLLATASAVGQLKIGVLESSMPIVRSAVVSSNLTQMVTLFPINTGNTSSSLEGINITYHIVSALELDALVGPFDKAFDLVAQALDIPYMCTSHELRLMKSANTFEMLPNAKWVAQAILNLLKAFEWNPVAFFSDDDRGSPLLEQLVNNHTVIVRAWRLPARAERHHMNKALVEMRKFRTNKCIVILNKENLELLLDEALNLAMLTTPTNQWMFYDPGMEGRNVVTMHDQIRVNFTIISLMDFNDSLALDTHPKLEKVLTSDALQLLVSSFLPMNVFVPATNASVNQDTTSSTFVGALTNNQEYGHTGLLQFDPEGCRTNFSLSITTVIGDYSYPRGIWYSNPPELLPHLNLNTAVFPINQSAPMPLQGRKVKVVVIQEAPFTMLKKDHELRKGNDRFEGYSVDLIQEISQMLGFDYELYLVHDGKFGSQTASGEWNGIIGELLVGNATMSVAPVSVNANRERAVDFTKPFMTRHISVLMQVPKFQTSYFQFLNPFSPLVWGITMVAFVIVSGILYVLEKVGRSMHKEAGELPTVTIRESFWFIFGSLLQGSTDPMAFSLPGRILTSAWWFFALILISSYTANLAAFLTVKKINTPINSVTDLAQQSTIKYGTVKDTGITNFFENTNIDYFAKMWAQMSEIEPESLVESRSEGMKRVHEGNYAFFYDTTVNKYQTMTNCDLMEVGPAFDSKGFSIGVPPGASYLDQLSMAILKMSDTGRLPDLKTKWWDSSTCPDLGGAADETSSLHIENVAGVFFIVVGGIVLASAVCLAKYYFPNLFRAPDLLKHSSMFGSISRRRVKTDDDDGVDAQQL